MISMMTMLVALASVGTTADAQAQVWKGTGLMYDADGQVMSSYSVTLTRMPAGERKMRHTIEVVSDDGEWSKTFNEELTHVGKRRMRIQTEDGAGGALLLGDGFMSVYRTAGDRAYASTILFTGEGEMSILRHELYENRPVHYFTETLRVVD